jgi:16S rRNA (adenine1518-N6/adenine1519-N6)-dimethyltransferase
LAADLGVRPSKRLSQNFVVDPGIVRRIVAAARLSPGERVVEVGPGLGSLTLGLLEAGASVACVEVDPLLAAALPGTVAAFLGVPAPDAAPAPSPGAPISDMAGDGGRALAQVAGPDPRRFVVVEADALAVEALPSGRASALVANLPYSVATKVLLRFLERFDAIRHGLVMVQAEVAARLTAPPGSRTYGVPSAKLAWWAEARLAGRIPRNAFFPVPRVDSELVYFERREPPAAGVPRRRVFEVVDAAFAARRKTLRGALAGLAGGADRAEAALAAAGIAATARGETLGIDEFARLAEALEAAGSAGAASGGTGPAEAGGAPMWAGHVAGGTTEQPAGPAQAARGGAADG